MKRLSDHLSALTTLRDVEEITLTDLRRHIGEVMDMCAHGRTFVLKRGRRVMGVLTQEANVDMTKHVWRDGSIHLIPDKLVRAQSRGQRG